MRGNKRNGVNLIRWKWLRSLCCDSCRFCSLFIVSTYRPHRPHPRIKIPLCMCLTIRMYAARICTKPKTINSLYHILVKILSYTSARTRTHCCGALTIIHANSLLRSVPRTARTVEQHSNGNRNILNISLPTLHSSCQCTSHCNKLYLF